MTELSALVSDTTTKKQPEDDNLPAIRNLKL